MILVEDLTKRFGPVVAVDHVSFQVREGEILGFLGPNGAGKSTTMRMVMGLVTPTAGRVTVAGHDAVRDSLAARRLIGHLPEGTPLYGDMTVNAFLRFVAEAKGVASADRAGAVERAKTECGLEEMGDRLIRHLSKGFRQRTGLAQAVLGDPPVLVLDEPTIGLDPRQIIEIRRLVRGWAGRRTVILSTHILPEVEVTCDRVIIISSGRLRAEGTPARLVAAAGGEALRLAVVAPASEVEAILKALPEVVGIEIEGNGDSQLTRARLIGNDLQRLRQAVTAEILRRGWDLHELGSGGGLEQAFLDAIGEGEEP
jgi:ABC-2 type transport system ATP-binding protein